VRTREREKDRKRARKKEGKKEEGKGKVNWFVENCRLRLTGGRQYLCQLSGCLCGASGMNEWMCAINGQ
jgi:hypothetical protein